MIYVAEPDESRQIRGEILAEATTIERYLTDFISNYFAKDNEKGTELYNWIFNTELLTFREKIELCKKIIQNLKWTINGECRKEQVIGSFIFINEIRNKVAHWEWCWSKTTKEDYYLQNPRKNEEILKLDKELLEKYDQCIHELLQFFDVWEDDKTKEE